MKIETKVCCFCAREEETTTLNIRVPYPIKVQGSKRKLEIFKEGDLAYLSICHLCRFEAVEMNPDPLNTARKIRYALEELIIG